MIFDLLKFIFVKRFYHEYIISKKNATKNQWKNTGQFIFLKTDSTIGTLPPPKDSPFGEWLCFIFQWFFQQIKAYHLKILSLDLKTNFSPSKNIQNESFVGFVSKDAVKQLEEAGAKAEIESFGNMSNFFEIRHCGTMFEWVGVLLLMVQKSCKLTSWGWQFIPLFTRFYTSQVVPSTVSLCEVMKL